MMCPKALQFPCLHDWETQICCRGSDDGDKKENLVKQSEVTNQEMIHHVIWSILLTGHCFQMQRSNLWTEGKYWWKENYFSERREIKCLVSTVLLLRFTRNIKSEQPLICSLSMPSLDGAAAAFTFAEEEDWSLSWDSLIDSFMVTAASFGDPSPGRLVAGQLSWPAVWGGGGCFAVGCTSLLGATTLLSLGEMGAEAADGCVPSVTGTNALSCEAKNWASIAILGVPAGHCMWEFGITGSWLISAEAKDWKPTFGVDRLQRGIMGPFMLPPPPLLIRWGRAEPRTRNWASSAGLGVGPGLNMDPPPPCMPLAQCRTIPPPLQLLDLEAIGGICPPTWRSQAQSDCDVNAHLSESWKLARLGSEEGIVIFRPLKVGSHLWL